MSKVSAAVTHATVIMVQSAADMGTMNGTMAHVTLSFQVDGAITFIAIKKMAGPTPGLTAHIPKTPIVVDGKRVWMPVIRGAVADELKMAALVAFDKIKQKHGLKYGKSYNVFENSIEEL